LNLPQALVSDPQDLADFLQDPVLPEAQADDLGAAWRQKRQQALGAVVRRALGPVLPEAQADDLGVA
jgi:hypothetical protein